MRATCCRIVSVATLVLAVACSRETPRTDVATVRSASRDDTVAVRPAQPATAQTGTAGTPGSGPSPIAGRQVYIATGRIERLDAATGHVVIAHEEIPPVNLKAGSTEFVAEKRDPLALLKPGQSIDFSFTPLSEGGYMITEIAPTPPTH